ncbi:MAG: tetratricopeptide repeat protein [Chloroflexi bacterium]|nr:tetratricopeptide repeat protein [Chloroflexota bacterium]
MRNLLLVAALMAALLALVACGGGGGGPTAEMGATTTAAPAPQNEGASLTQLEEAAQKNPSVDAYFQLGNAYARQGRLSDAQEAYEKALNINPNHAATLSNLGVVLYQLGKLNEAKAQFEKALQVNPNDAPTHYLLGATLLQMNDLAGAEKSFQKALELDPVLPEAHFGMGMLRRLQGRIDEAIAEFETFLAGPPAQDPRARGEAERILEELRGQ